MVEKLSAEQAYMNQVMSRLPSVERGEAYQIKNGDSLWNIAKKELGTSQKADIQNYMYQIAKLNGMTTIEAMNKLTASNIIYLPKETKAAPAKGLQKAAVVQNPNKTQGASKTNKVDKTSAVKPRTAAETSILNLTQQLKTDGTVTIEKMHKFGESSNDLYHVYCMKKEPGMSFYSRKSPLMSVTVDRKTGKFTEISFNEQPVTKNPSHYDYNLDVNGNIKTYGYIRQTQQGKISADELKNLHTLLNGLISKTYGK